MAGFNYDEATKSVVTLYNSGIINDEEYDDLMNKIKDERDHIAFVLTDNLEKDEARFF